jgi:hypothetical protein
MSTTSISQAAQPAVFETEKNKPLPRRPMRHTQLDLTINQIGTAPVARLVCVRVNPRVREGFYVTAFDRRSSSLDPTTLLNSDVNELKNHVKLLATLCADIVKGVSSRSPESWAGEFLHLPMNDAQAFFERAARNAYARMHPRCHELVMVAAAFAWKLRKADPKFTVPGTLSHTLRQLRAEDRVAWAQNAAAFQAHSYDLANDPLSREELEENLKRLLPQ